MPRQNRRRIADPRPGGSTESGRIDTWRGGDYAVRAVTGARASKEYRCPGCDQLVLVGVPHVVAWPLSDPDARRHWHTPCWAARDRRGPGVGRSRSAPRY